ncbi:Xanthine dehydrogenase [Hypsibius exemplaris]|uniref:Xanthine dehydrogenase n=1 Tax=Hypsibius exemplaris TaxID=2072580 RepID=A0A1W0X6H7_HYPEX|nr:Xanthine dehydrogenase [Hypsibius exemplaris]
MTPPIATSAIVQDDKITVTINGMKYDVPTSFSEVSLNQYLREHLQLTGTKITCREGGCGVCTVHVAHPDPLNSQQFIQKSINSCLCPILSCDKWDITTVEGVGNQTKPHPIQSALTSHYDTQCGYCTPGWVMNMCSILQNNSENLTQQDVENACDGNICRCTGYRPILEAFKTFAKDHPSKCGTLDIEDEVQKGLCKTTGKACSGSCHGKSTHYIKALSAAAEFIAPPWYRPTNLLELYEKIKALAGQNVYYVVGHTGMGVYNDAPCDAYVDLKGIPELYGTTLTASLLKQNCTHHSIRNSGSWAGNLAMKNRHKDFPSDSFVAFTVGNAKIFVGGPDMQSYSPKEFLDADLKGKIILRVEFQPFDSDFVFRTFKVMPRSGNAHAYVNAGFRAKVDRRINPGQVVIVEEPMLAFGNINASMVSAEKTAKFLQGKNIADQAILQQALTMLNDEIVPMEGDPSEANVRYRSAVGNLVRPLSSGKQEHGTKPENYPLTQPMPKLESMAQCTGEAKYTSDIELEGMLHAAFVLTTLGNAAIFEVDIKPAMTFPGVTRVLVASDIPGANNIGPLPNDPEELLASKRSLYAGQPVALVVATSQDIAERAAKLVKISYYDVKTPTLNCRDAIKNQSYVTVPGLSVGDADKAIAGAANKIEGELEIGTQNHMYMETEDAVTFPTEDGLNVECGTQWIYGTQISASQCCGIGLHRINVTVKRSGGGLGKNSADGLCPQPRQWRHSCSDDL